MRWTDHVFRYCERGFDPGLWAEPVNALSNVAFLGVAVLAAARMARPLPQDAVASDRLTTRLIHPLIALVALIGVGSFLFHVAATRWAQLADVLPIGAFIQLYLIFALRCMAGLSVLKVMLGLAALIAAFAASMAFCPSAMSGGPGRPACLNDTLGYAPALAALFAVAVLLRRRSHPAAGRLLLAAAVLLLSMVMRTIDLDQCSVLSLEDRPLGSHFLWHLLNALVLHLLLTAAVDEARRSAR
ncbi:MAG: ceramidase domain-containing protein [Hyphomicrobiaceae bacterium]